MERSERTRDERPRHDRGYDDDRQRFDRNYRNPEVVAAFKQKGTDHPITVVQYRDSDDNELFRIFWNNKRHEHEPFTSKEKAIDYIETSTKGKIRKWFVQFRPLMA